MSFVKGVMVGSLISAGIAWMCIENNSMSTKKIMKKGKKFLKNMGN